MQDLLFWRKYRPQSIKGMVLLPRIKIYLENGFRQNVILHGHSGTGKSTIVDILLKDKNVLKINASIDNGIDLLRDKMLDFCDSMPSPFVKTTDKMKYVYLEEFDKATGNFQEGFKAFVEKYDDRVRFIISMNDVSSVIEPLHSRFQKINFNPSNDEERSYLLTGYYKYIASIVKHTKMELDTKTIKNIVEKNFPDLRSSVVDIETIFITGNVDTSSSENHNVYSFIMDGNNNFSENYYFVMDNWVNQPKDLIDILGRPLFSFLLKNHKEIINNKGFELLSLSKQYNVEFETTTDPPLHVFSYICELKKILTPQFS